MHPIKEELHDKFLDWCRRIKDNDPTIQRMNFHSYVDEEDTTTATTSNTINIDNEIVCWWHPYNQNYLWKNLHRNYKGSVQILVNALQNNTTLKDVDLDHWLTHWLTTSTVYNHGCCSLTSSTSNARHDNDNILKQKANQNSDEMSLFYQMKQFLCNNTQLQVLRITMHCYIEEKVLLPLIFIQQQEPTDKVTTKTTGKIVPICRNNNKHHHCNHNLSNLKELHLSMIHDNSSLLSLSSSLSLWPLKQKCNNNYNNEEILLPISNFIRYENCKLVKLFLYNSYLRTKDLNTLAYGFQKNQSIQYLELKSVKCYHTRNNNNNNNNDDIDNNNSLNDIQSFFNAITYNRNITTVKLIDCCIDGFHTIVGNWFQLLEETKCNVNSKSSYRTNKANNNIQTLYVDCTDYRNKSIIINPNRINSLIQFLMTKQQQKQNQQNQQFFSLVSSVGSAFPRKQNSPSLVSAAATATNTSDGRNRKDNDRSRSFCIRFFELFNTTLSNTEKNVPASVYNTPTTTSHTAISCDADDVCKNLTLKSMYFPNLETIRLITTMLQYNYCNLEALCLENNNFTFEDCTLIAQGLATNNTLKSFSLLQTQKQKPQNKEDVEDKKKPNRRRLLASPTSYTDEAWKEMLIQNKTLKQLEISFVLIYPYYGLDLLFKGLAKNASLQRLTIFGPNYHYNHFNKNIRELPSSSLSHYRKIRNDDEYDNDNSAFIRILAYALNTSSLHTTATINTTTYDRSICTLVELKLCCLTFCNDDDWVELGIAIQYNTCLTKLVLQNVGIGNKTLNSIATSLTCNKTLQILDVNGNNSITIDGIQSISSKLNDMNGLQQFYFEQHDMYKSLQFAKSVASNLRNNYILFNITYICKLTRNERYYLDLNRYGRHFLLLDNYNTPYGTITTTNELSHSLLLLWPWILSRITKYDKNIHLLHYFVCQKPELFIST